MMTNMQAAQLLHGFLSRVNITGAEAPALMELVMVCERALLSSPQEIANPSYGVEDSLSIQSRND
jgi:hypothetical protein